jgi:hypothetical protein
MDAGRLVYTPKNILELNELNREFNINAFVRLCCMVKLGCEFGHKDIDAGEGRHRLHRSMYKSL